MDMTTKRVLAEVSHPSVYLAEEMEARGWSVRDAAGRMSGDFGRNALALAMYLACGCHAKHARAVRIGEHAAKRLGEAFNVEAQFFLNLERTFLDHMDTAKVNLLDPDTSEYLMRGMPELPPSAVRGA